MKPQFLQDLRAHLKKDWAGEAIGVLLAVGAGVLLHMFTFGSGLVNLSYDLLLVARPHLPAPEAALVYLDEKSHMALNQPYNAPWDRALHARLIDRLSAAGARAIVFDIVFSDPNPLDPAADQALAEAIRKSGRVVLGCGQRPTGAKAENYMTVPPFDLVRDASVGIGSAEIIPGPRSDRQTTHTEQAASEPELGNSRVPESEGYSAARARKRCALDELLRPWRLSPRERAMLK